jgi:hypothetical protein
MPKFSAGIYKLGINPVVDPPDDVLEGVFAQAGKSKGPIPVRGLINGAEFIQTLVKYSGRWRLYVNGEMLKASGLKVGEVADIEIEHDVRPREMPTVPEFEIALAADERAAKAFVALTPSRKKEILTYLGHRKTKVSLRKNIEKLISRLAGGSAR